MKNDLFFCVKCSLPVKTVPCDVTGYCKYKRFFSLSRRVALNVICTSEREAVSINREEAGPRPRTFEPETPFNRSKVN